MRFRAIFPSLISYVQTLSGRAQNKRPDSDAVSEYVRISHMRNLGWPGTSDFNQAEAIASGLVNGLTDNLATKDELHSEIALLRGDMNGEFTLVRSEMAAMEERLEGKIDSVEERLNGKISRRGFRYGRNGGTA